MRKRKFNILSSSSTFLLVILLMLTMISGSFGINMTEATRGVSAKVVSHENAFVGIQYRNLYSVILQEDGSDTTIPIFVENNLPHKVYYEIDLSGMPIRNYSPKKFTLGPNKKEEIVMTLFNIDEAVEGYSEILGNIRADFNSGSVDVDFEFGIDVQLPEIIIEDIESSIDQGITLTYDLEEISIGIENLNSANENICIEEKVEDFSEEEFEDLLK